MIEKQTLDQLMSHLPQQGKVEWLGIRPEKRKPLEIVDSVTVLDGGLKDDHYIGRSRKRSVTLVQAEHISILASLLHREEISPDELRRNIVVSGINLLALKNREFRIGGAVLKMSGLCHPCSRMEEALGEGGYNAMRGHGGINASVVTTGIINLGDTVKILEV